MTFEEWWKEQSKEDFPDCDFSNDKFACESGWNARQAEIDELKEEVARYKEWERKKWENVPEQFRGGIFPWQSPWPPKIT